MTTSKEWQLQRDAAEQYERVLVPSILGPFARALVERSSLRAGESVLDVGCGTGAAARYAAAEVGPAGRVTGVDVNPGMIEVANSLSPVDGAPIDWLVKSAYELPFSDGTFDVVLCAQTLQFLPERSLALSEMYRALRPGGRVCLTVWCGIQESPYFDALVASISEHIGGETASGLKAAFALSDPEETRSLLGTAGFCDVAITQTHLGLRLPAPEEFVSRHISATPMGPAFAAAPSQDQLAVVRDMAKRLSRFDSEGMMTVPFNSHLAAGCKPSSLDSGVSGEEGD